MTVKVLTVADIHRRATHYTALRKVVTCHNPDIVAFVGDFLHAFDDNAGRLTPQECASVIGGLPCSEILFVRGNHEDDQCWEFFYACRSTGRKLHLLHRQALACGPLVTVGFPCLLGDETGFVDPLVSGQSPAQVSGPADWLPNVLRSSGAASRSLWLMHEPPAGTQLTQRTGPAAGCPEWTEAIESYRPKLVVTGHDHFTPIRSKRWHDTLGDTHVVNVGQTANGELHYALVEAQFPSEKPGLPSHLKVTAFPVDEQLVVNGR